ncbi:inositol monophosphatase 1-like [Tribolium madens]|uniref:inositol monophosphatase 1-like n=1 Tax=Tribolium madens TaxID=41895 RepID=UPI001CF729F7|nr:inositol monophosphatase 1-like [Tribolium madens]
MSEQIQIYFDFVLPLVKKAGKVILEAKNIEIETKDEIYDLVTIYDRKVEDVLIKEIKSKYPNHKFIGEEESSAKSEISQLTNDPTWIIDPIDGTANFVRNFPITCISIGLTINQEPVLGVIYNPFMDELYTAMKGQGAYLNGKRIFTSRQTDIQKSVLNYELSLARSEKHRELYLYRLTHLIAVIQGIRSMGSAALGLCYVARGSMDAYQCDGLYPWDVAAGVLIVKEAGGAVGDSTLGKEFDIMKPNFIATASKTLLDQFLQVEKRADDERLAALLVKKANVGCK